MHKKNSGNNSNAVSKPASARQPKAKGKKADEFFSELKNHYENQDILKNIQENGNLKF